MSVVEEAGLRPKIVDTDFFALQNAFELNYPQGPSEAAALIDMGASGMKICIVHRGVPVFTKDSALGGRSLTADIQKHLNLSYVDAENLKSGQGGQIPQEVSDLMSVAADNMAQEIKRTLDFYNASGTGPRVSLILLAGGSAKIPNLTQVIDEHTSVKTQLLNPFSTIQVDSRMFTQDYVSAIAPLAAVPLGLALRAGTP
jgi:type IV pilus assembly protein PilM